MTAVLRPQAPQPHTPDGQGHQTPRIPVTLAQGDTRDRPFQAKTLGYFEPDNDADAVETRDNGTIYHNIFSFTQRVKVMTNDDTTSIWYGPKIDRHLHQCLLGNAEQWFTNVISQTTRAGMMTNIDLWCTELEKRFRDAPGQALTKLERLKYTMSDAQDRKDPEQFILKVLSLGKSAHTVFPETDAVLTAFEHIDLQLRLTMLRPNEKTTLDQFMTELNAVRNDWFAMADRITRARDKAKTPAAGYSKQNPSSKFVYARSFSQRQYQSSPRPQRQGQDEYRRRPFKQDDVRPRDTQADNQVKKEKEAKNWTRKQWPPRHQDGRKASDRKGRPEKNYQGDIASEDSEGQEEDQNHSDSCGSSDEGEQDLEDTEDMKGYWIEDRDSETEGAYARFAALHVADDGTEAGLGQTINGQRDRQRQADTKP